MMVIEKRMPVVAVALCAAYCSWSATLAITDVTAQQRYPRNVKVDISYTVTGDIAAVVKQHSASSSWFWNCHSGWFVGAGGWCSGV